MSNATDTMVGSFFSEEAERIKKKSRSSLMIGFAVAVPCMFIMMGGFFFTVLFSVRGGLLILFLSILGFLVGVAFMLRFAVLRMKLAKYVGAQVRNSQQQP